jgi:hypothetical protein
MPAGRSGNHGPFGVGQNLQWNPSGYGVIVRLKLETWNV